MMRKKIKRIHIWLLVLTALLGGLLGTGVALLCLNLTTDAKGVSFAGLICLILVAALCLSLPLVVHYRDTVLNRLVHCNAVYGREVSFLDEDAFFKKHGQEIATVYALHPKVVFGDDLAIKTVFYSLCDALEEYVAPIASIGYARTGEFLFIVDNENTLMDALKRVEEKMLKDDTIPPFILLLGLSETGADITERASEAITATLIDSSIRESLSLVAYTADKEKQMSVLNLANEEDKGRLRYDMDEYLHDEERVTLVSPALYDAIRGEIKGKELFRRCDLFHVREEFDLRCVSNAVNYLKGHEGVTAIVRLGADSLESADFLPKMAEVVKSGEVPCSSIMIMIPALQIDSIYVRTFINHAKGLGFRIGVYEYGGENILSLTKIAPEIMMFKSENTRQNAPRNELDALLNVANAISSKAFLEEGLLGQECSYYQKEAQKEEEA